MSSGDNRTPLLMSVQAGMASGATVAVVLRFYTRIHITRSVRWDDWFMLLAMIFSWGVSGPGLVSAHYGMGRRTADLEPSNIPKALMWVWIARLSTIISFAFVKLSIALLLMRIASVKRPYRYLLYGSMVVNVCVSIIWFIMTVKCVPASANWLGEQPGDTCIPGIVTVQHAYWAGAAHSALDLLYAVLPIFLVWDLQLSTRTKLGIACLLSLGLFACACSIKKITETARLGAATDITWEFTDLSIWNMVELNVGIICGSLPCTRALWRRVWYGSRNLVSSSGGGKGRSGDGGLRGTKGYGYGYGNGSGYGKMGGSRYAEGTGGGHGRASFVPSGGVGGGGKVGEGESGETYMLRSGLKHHGGVTTSRIRGGDDADSEENILPMHGGIMQTTEVEVKYDGSVVTDGEEDGVYDGTRSRGQHRVDVERELDAGRPREREGSGSGLSGSERAMPRNWGDAK